MLKGICTTVAAPLLSVVTGTVQDASTGEAVIGAAVILQNTTYGAVADADGRFVINNVKPGTYTIEVQMLSYQRVVIEGCQIKPGENTLPLISLQPSAEEIDEVVVTTVRRLSSEAAVMQAVRNSKMVVSGVSKQMIARTQDRDAGEVVRRIPGISIIDDKFIVARGLSQRYNNVWVNDAAIPSSEADSRAFSFDLIPAGQIENIMILKSPVPEIPADFTGGFVKINTKDTPGELPFALSYSIGFNTATFGHDFLYNPGSGSDWFGCDNGKRGVRGGITGAFDNDDPDFVTDMTRHGFNNDWSIKTRKPIPDQRFSFSYGHSFRLGNGADLALNGALNYSYATRTFSNMENSRYGVYNKVEDKPEYYYKYTDDQYQTNVKVGALLNLAYLNGKNRYYFRNIFNQIGQDKLTLREGWQNMSSLYIQEKTEYCYTSRSTYSGQIAGVHTLELGTLDWDAGYSYADKNQPDRRIVNRQENDMVGDAHYGQMQIDQNEIRRDFMKLREHIASAGINYSCTLREGSSFAPELKVGLYGEYRTRDYRTRAYFYRFDTDNLPADFAYGDVIDDILQDGNYGADKLYIYDDSDNRNTSQSDRQTFTSTDKLVLYNDENRSKTLNLNHRFNSRIDYKFSDRHSVMMRTSFSLQDNNSRNELRSRTDNKFSDDDIRFVYRRRNFGHNNSDGYNVSNYLLYRYRLPGAKSHNLTVGAGGTYRSYEQLSRPRQYTFRDPDNIECDTSDYSSRNITRTDRDQPGYDVNGNVSYTRSLSKRSRLSFEYRINYPDNSVERNPFVLTKENVFPDERNPRQSTEYDYAYLTHRIGSTYQYYFKKTKIAGTLHYQHAAFSSDYAFPYPP